MLKRNAAISNVMNSLVLDIQARSTERAYNATKQDSAKNGQGGPVSNVDRRGAGWGLHMPFIK